MPNRVFYTDFPGANLAGAAGFSTAAERALLARADLVSWFDAKMATTDGSVAALVTALASRKLASDGTEQLLTPSASTDAPSLATTTDGQKGLVPVVGASGNTKRTLRGNGVARLPGLGSGASVTGVTIAGGTATGVTGLVGGSGYTLAPYVKVTADGTAPTATATVSGGAVTGVTFTGGSGNTTVAIEFVAAVAPCTVSCLASQPVGINSTLWATNDANQQLAYTFDTTNKSRFYTKYSSGLMMGNTTDNDGALHNFSFTYDGANITTRRGSTVLKTQATVLPLLPSRVLRIGSLNNAGTDPTVGYTGAIEQLIVNSGAPSAAIDAAVNAVFLERHALLAAA